LKTSLVEKSSTENLPANEKTSLITLISDREYLQTCFDYIHHNPQEAGLVKDAIDWEFSSYSEYLNLRNWNLINKLTADELGLICEAFTD